MIARGIRNNNPLNVRRSKDKWQGMKPLQTDPQFCQFETMPYGWRAAFVSTERGFFGRYKHQTSDYGYWGDLIFEVLTAYGCLQGCP